MKPEEIYAAVSEMVRDCHHVIEQQGGPLRPLAMKLLYKADPDIVFAMAVDRLVDLAQQSHRGSVRRTEREATRPRAGTPDRKRWEKETDEGQDWAKQRAESKESLRVAMEAMLLANADNYRRQVHFEWTPDLLPKTWSVYQGGPIVSWGTASPQDHRTCALALTKHAGGEMITAAQHLQAEEDCLAAGCESLNEVVSKESAA